MVKKWLLSLLVGSVSLLALSNCSLIATCQTQKADGFDTSGIAHLRISIKDGHVFKATHLSDGKDIPENVIYFLRKYNGVHRLEENCSDFGLGVQHYREYKLAREEGEAIVNAAIDAKADGRELVREVPDKDWLTPDEAHAVYANMKDLYEVEFLDERYDVIADYAGDNSNVKIRDLIRLIRRIAMRHGKVLRLDGAAGEM